MRRIFALLGLAVTAGVQALPPGFYDRPLFAGLSGPTCVAFAPDGRVFAGQKTGAIRIYKNKQLLFTPFMNVKCTSNSERGVLGLALDPNFAANRYVYVYYTTSAQSLNPPATPKNRVSRFVAEGDLVRPGSEEILLDDIPSDHGNHNAGCIRFGPDGKLWIATGDGGETPAQSQDLNSLAGKLLRIDADGSIPTDNPFVGQSGARPEVWAYGFRNPFRFNFRPGTMVPYVGDVGAVTWEEIDVAVPGGNFGWPTAEGIRGIPGLIDPIFAYPHNGQSRSVTGGIFLKSPRYPAAMANRYLFADYVQDALFYLDVDAGNSLVANGSFGFADGPVDFVYGPGDAVYYVAIVLGQIRKLTYEPRPAAVNLPTEVIGGQSGQGSVVLDVVAPAQGLDVSVQSSDPAAIVPGKVSVPSNATAAGFQFSTAAVSSETTVSITATTFSKSISGTLRILPNTVKALYLPASVKSGSRVRGYVSLVAPAGSGLTVDITAEAAVQIPASVVIAPGSSSTGFWIEGREVSAATAVTIAATLHGASKSKSITVLPADLVSLSVAPNPIVGGEDGTGTVDLFSNAEAGGAEVALSDDTTLIATPPSVSVPAGQSRAAFGFSTVNISVQATRTMRATYRGVTRTTTVNLLP